MKHAKCSATDEIWIVTEGAAGMENQCLGLAERLGRPMRVFRVQLAQPWRWLAPLSLGSPLEHLTLQSDRPMPPWPRLLIGCGRQSIPISVAIRRASSGGTVTVQCQDPRVHPDKFDLVIPPEHDGLRGANVFPLVGSPNRITPAKLQAAREQFSNRFSPLRAPRVAVLVGGRSRTHGSLDLPTAQRFGNLLIDAARDHGLMVTMSRRTPEGAAQAIRDSLSRTDALVWGGSDPNPYLGMLGWADAFVVTSDSVNMECEAATTGKAVHVFPVRGGKPKATAFQDSLLCRGITRPFEGQIEQWSYAPLDETGRAASRIQALLDARGVAADMGR